MAIAVSSHGDDGSLDSFRVASAVVLGALALTLAAATAQDLWIAFRDPVVSGHTDGSLAGVAFWVLLLAPVALSVACVERRLATAFASTWWLAALNGAAVAFVLASALQYDDYYDSGTRYIDDGPVGAGAIAVLAAFAFVVTLTPLTEPPRRLAR